MVTASRFNQRRWLARAGHGARLFAALALAIVLARYSAVSPIQYDVTRTQTHTLADPSIAVLDAIEEPLAVSVYLPDAHPHRDPVAHLLNRYQRHRPSMTVEYIDPASDPERVRTADIREGELVLESNGRTERTAVYSEQAVTESLARLARAENRWIVFVSGHGERRPRRGANHDVSDWAMVLERRGFNVQVINLSELPNVPDNTSVLVLASPQLAFPAPEAGALMRYLERGGSMLWLTEPNSPKGLEALERAIGFERIAGTVVDPVTLAHGVDNPAFVLVNRYADHPTTANFEYTTVMFYAAGIHERPSKGWSSARLLYSGDQAWSETDPLEGNVAYDEELDFIGPLPLAIAKSRIVNTESQRVIVVGDGDFLANAYLQNSGNQDLGVRLVEWLARDDTLIDIPSRVALDNSLVLEDWHKAVIGALFLFVLPAAFLLNGVLIWWRRRRA